VAQALKKSEIESLLEELKEGVIELEEPESSGDVEIVPYDFSKPHSLSRTFESNLATVSDTFAKGCAINLSSYYRSTVSVTPEGLRHVLFQEFIKYVAKPSCLAIVTLSPLRGQAVCNIEPNLIFALVDKLLGGKGKAIEEPRDFTEIELKISQKIVSKILSDLKVSMERFVDLNPSLSRIENNPEFVNICPGLERVVSLDFKVELGETEGAMNICIPIAAFEPVIEKFDPVEEVPERTPQEKMQDLKNISEAIKEVLLDVNVVIGEKEVPLAAINELKVGDTLILDKKASEPVDVLVEGIVKFLGIPGKTGGRKAVKIAKVIREE